MCYLGAGGIGVDWGVEEEGVRFGDGSVGEGSEGERAFEEDWGV